MLAAIWCAICLRIQSAVGRYIYFLQSVGVRLGCKLSLLRLECRLSLPLLTRTLINDKVLPLMPWRAHTFVHSNKSMQKCISLAKTESFYQRKVSFLPHAHRRQLESFILSPSKCKRCTAYHIFSFAVG